MYTHKDAHSWTNKQHFVANFKKWNLDAQKSKQIENMIWIKLPKKDINELDNTEI